VRVLVSGAGIAGSVLAYWLARRGIEVTVVECEPSPGLMGGHAVGLFRPALEISERMGVLAAIRSLAVDAAPGGAVEILRDDLAGVFRAAGGDVEYVFGDSLTGIDAEGGVTFERMPGREFDVIVGADGTVSTVRRLTFGADAAQTRFLGACVAAVSVPKEFAVPARVVHHLSVGRRAAIYTADHLAEARAVFWFRSDELAVGGADAADRVRAAFAGMHPEVDRWLAELDRTPPSYFAPISQLRMDRLSRRRVTLVGDAGYCPGPGIGGATTLAVLGAYVLAGELARAGGDQLRAFAAYELAMREPVRLSRGFSRNALRALLPGSRIGVRAAARRPTSTMVTPPKGVRVHDSMALPD